MAQRSESKSRAKSASAPASSSAAAKPDVPAIPPAPALPEPALKVDATPYTVVARRYRPQRFDDLVGQDHVVRALKNAIKMNRLAQAYLFCGTRGVGKTSIARIFAKCLNCVRGPTDEPDQTCDICQAIAAGQDVDVIEIDGASNNGVEQVRELRQNAALRPSRARYKIYYIDEVHMLSTGAFNALLKTLEEPPPHVKFFFATTEPNKIPITVLSRCQRYDFAGITPELIATTLRGICERENVGADAEALQVVARRAGGSLRDAQSLLDRLLASGHAHLTVEAVHASLGTASDERLLAMLEAFADHDPAQVLTLVDRGMNEGVQPAELIGGVIDFVRDAMVLAAGAESLLLAVTPRRKPDLKRIVDRWTFESILAALQILSECRSRMRGSLHGRQLVEMALVKVTQLDRLTALAPLVERLTALESGAPRAPRPEPRPAPSRPPAAVQAPDATREPSTPPLLEHRQEPPTIAPPNIAPPPPPPSPPPPPPPRMEAEPPARSLPRIDEPNGLHDRPQPVAPAEPPARIEEKPAASEPAGHSEPPHEPQGEPSQSLDLDTVLKAWPNVIKKIPTTLRWRFSQVDPVAMAGPDLLIIAAKPGFNSETVEESCGTPDALEQLERTLQKHTHRPVKIKYERSAGHDRESLDPATADARRTDVLKTDPLVQKVVELFEARTVKLEYEDRDLNLDA